MTTIHRETLAMDAAGKGSVEVTINGETRRVDCEVFHFALGKTLIRVGAPDETSSIFARDEDGHIWPAVVCSNDASYEFASFGPTQIRRRTHRIRARREGRKKLGLCFWA